MKLIESKTYQNLARAYVGETQAYVRYQFVEYGARNEGYNALADVEKQHKKIFDDLHNQLKNGTLYKKDKATTWRCSGCGYEASSKEAWDECPLCKAKQGFVNVKTSAIK